PLYRHTIFMSDLFFAEIPFALVTTLFFILNKKSEKSWSFLPTALLGVAAYLLRTAGLALLAAWVAESLLHRRWKQAALRGAVSLLPVAAWQAYVGGVTSGEEYRHPAYEDQRAPYQYYNVGYAENILLIDSFVPELGRASLGDLAERFFGNLALMPASLGEAVTGGRGLWQALRVRAEQELGGVSLPPWLDVVPNLILGGLILSGAGVLLS